MVSIGHQSYLQHVSEGNQKTRHIYALNLQYIKGKEYWITFLFVANDAFRVWNSSGRKSKQLEEAWNLFFNEEKQLARVAFI